MRVHFILESLHERLWIESGASVIEICGFWILQPMIVFQPDFKPFNKGYSFLRMLSIDLGYGQVYCTLLLSLQVWTLPIQIFIFKVW